MKDFSKQFYASQAWHKCRAGYIAYRHGICERCGGLGTIVHHKVYLTPDNINDPEVSLNWDNLELLCQDCHNNEHQMEGRTQDGLVFDSEGNLVKK